MFWSRLAKVSKTSFQRNPLIVVQPATARLIGDGHEYRQKLFDPPVTISEEPNWIIETALLLSTDCNAHIISF